MSSERPLLVCVDDADRLDASSLAQLAALVESATTLPLLFVLACGPDALRQLGRGSVVRLPPLPTEDCQQLARRLCATFGQEPRAAIVEWCVGVASGNPGHLELLIRHHTSVHGTPSVPLTLIALLDERLQSLSLAARHVLQACVIYGSDCPPDVVSALTGLEGYELLSTLESLILHGLVTDSPSGITCRSSLLAERVAATITATIRTLLNSRAASYLERHIDKNSSSQSTAWRIADHWQAAGLHEKSLHWRRVCWQHLISIGQPVAAADSIRACISACTSLQERAEMLDQLAAALRNASDARAQLVVLEERTALSDTIGDSVSSRVSLAADIAEARYHTYEDTTKLLPELRALLRDPLLDEERRLRIARVWIVTADSMISEPLAHEALAAVPKAPRSSSSASISLEIQAIYHATFGDRRTAIELAELLHAVASKQELTPARVFSHLTACLALRISDSRPTEVAFLTYLYERSVAASMIGAAIRVAARLGSMLHEDGDLGGARLWCARTTDLIERFGILRLTTDYVTLCVDIALADGELELARRRITSAPSQCPMYSSPKWNNALHVYRTRVEQHEGNSHLTPERLSSLIEWHRTAGHLGRNDDHMEVLWRALTAAGRSTEDSETLRKYLARVRREQRDCIYALRTTAASDPAWSTWRCAVAQNQATTHDWVAPTANHGAGFALQVREC